MSGIKKIASVVLACLALSTLSPPITYAAQDHDFSFGVFAQPLQSDVGNNALKLAIAESDADNLAFVVANGIKAASESCTEDVWQKRLALLQSAKNGLIVSLLASDWTACRDSGGRPIPFESINRLRELFFNGEFSFGDSKIPLTRQSLIPRFRNYAENMRWQIHDVIFATLNIPANNNNYVFAAGRNSEFEDREIANHDWLQRIFLMAKVQKLQGIVIFCDADPFIGENQHARAPDRKRNGFKEIRHKIESLSKQYSGKVLVVHNEERSEAGGARASDTDQIIWHQNIGTLHISAPWRKITVTPRSPGLFSVTRRSANM